MNAVGAGMSAFREAMLHADPRAYQTALDFDSFGQWEARCVRYDLFWSLYQNNAYQDLLHKGWATRYKVNFGLYKHIRHLYNPAYRLGEFWAGRLQGGKLDRDAGDGESEQSALPILTDNEAIRPALSRLWIDSHWQVNKEVYGRFGSVLGDVALKVEDDPVDGRMRLRVIHPGKIKWVCRNNSGHLESYIIQEARYDPRSPTDAIKYATPTSDPRTASKAVTYTETAYLDGDTVHYATYLDGSLYPWNGEGAEWDEPYGFIPLYLCQHEPIGMDWGLGCFHSGLSRFREVDDQASGLGDQIRKAIRGPWLLAGVGKGKLVIPNADDPATVNKPDADRSDMPYLTAQEGATATPLVFPLDIVGVAGHIKDLLADIEANYPELLSDTGGISGTPTAEAVRRTRQVASAKVQARRATYDDCLIRAQQGAIAIGGWRGYDGYAGFGLDDIRGGRLDHQVGHRPVFEVDPLDSLNEDQAFWTAAGLAVKAGVPLEVYLERNGWSEDDLARLGQASEAADAKAIQRQQRLMMGDDPTGVAQ